MLLIDKEAVKRGKLTLPPSPAQVPLVTLLGVYFCALVDKTPTIQRYQESLSTRRNEVVDMMDETLAILPQMITRSIVSEEAADEYRKSAIMLKKWAHACTEPVSQGQIFCFTRMHLVSLHSLLPASQTFLLQTFLYLYEKRRLNALYTKRCGGGNDNGSDEDDYERLLGALMEDPRVARLLLQHGRPKTAQECDRALAQWCLIPPADGEMSELIGPSAMSSTIDRTMKFVTKRTHMQMEDLLSMQISNNNYGFTKEMRKRLPQSKKEDGDALRRYLI